MAMRGALARRQRGKYQDVWPINEAAARPPAGWPGWPGGKKFAFVLTHDVEGPDGLEKCRQLMQLEKELGFRSSFNFIPEANYAVSRQLREELAGDGFEVGVHDLHHDGKLFQSREGFSENARWINHYLKEWGAKGFRSGFMLRQMDWLHDLDIQYDASTFDTDPFEPQPDGVGTIFPFWVPVAESRNAVDGGQRIEVPGPRAKDRGQETEGFTSRRGYVELPYTLAQDSTLFMSLRERTSGIWLRKLDWIVEHGGMALVDVHPDYLRFPGEVESPRTYPVERYVELLEYVRHHHGGAYWQPLPREMAEFCAGIRPPRPNVPGRRIGMITYSAYERDNRVIRYAQTLAARGDTVEVIS